MAFHQESPNSDVKRTEHSCYCLFFWKKLMLCENILIPLMLASSFPLSVKEVLGTAA